MIYEKITNIEVVKILGYSPSAISKFPRIIERQKRLHNVDIIETKEKENGKKLYNLIIPEKQDDIPEGFLFKKEIIGLDSLAQELHYTYESIKTNWEALAQRQLKNFDRLIIKDTDLQNHTIFRIYEKPSEKNQDLDGEEWKQCLFNDSLLISNKGRIKVKKDGFITYGSLDNQGYYVYGSINENGQRMRVHREVLKAFQPREDSEQLFVDHINGIRSDNRLENLRWASAAMNNKYKEENNIKIQTKIAKLIQKYGYEELYQKLCNL